MKKLLLLFLCPPLIGIGQSANKDTIIKNLHDVIDSLEVELNSSEEMLQSYLILLLRNLLHHANS
jgi:hypothetical protein